MPNLTDISSLQAGRILESLRKGIPPLEGTDLYSMGQEKLLTGVRNYHLAHLSERGLIRFLSGSWGSGKTHFLRQLGQEALAADCALALVELNAGETPFNRFDRVFFRILAQIRLPQTEYGNESRLGRFLQTCLCKLGGDMSALSESGLKQAEATLLHATELDIDFSKMLLAYGTTFLSGSGDSHLKARERAEILQWFQGAGPFTVFRRQYGVSKMIDRQNARAMLESLIHLVRLMGFQGLVILLDEAEQACSLMRKSVLREAHNTLLALLNQIDSLPGIFWVYATTPDFFHDPRYGIVSYGALLGRIGKPEQVVPRALDTLWNLDAIAFSLKDYQQVAWRIAQLHQRAYANQSAPQTEEIQRFVETILEMHPALSAIRFWRVLITALVSHLDDQLEGEEREPAQTYLDIMDRLREE